MKSMEQQEGPQNEPQEETKQETQLDLPEIPQAQLPALPAYIPTEVSLQHLGFFTPSSKRIKKISIKEKTLKTITQPDGTKKEVKSTIIGNPNLGGLPITSDQDYWRAFEKILDETTETTSNGKKRFQLPVEVPIRKLIRYAGKNESSKERKEARQWIERMTGTLIKGGIYSKKRKDYDEGFIGAVFSQAVLRGQTTRNGRPADTNLIWPAPWYLSNYFHGNIRPIDYNFYKRLRKPISKSLAPLLETGWYASEGNPYQKRYSHLCQEFLLRHEKHLAHIKKQLDPSHRELQAEGLLARWDYRKLQNGDWIIVYYAGRKFFDDQKARLDRKQLIEPEKNTLNADQERALEDIKIIIGEPDNPYWQEIIKTYSLPLISMAIAETKQADLEHRISKNRGAYFVDVLKRLNESWKKHQTDSGESPTLLTGI